jgi:hypothetical protein
MHDPMSEPNDADYADLPENAYLKYRGKCKEMSEALVAADQKLTLVRGHYLCPIWGEQAHWWVKDATGKVIDPTKDQFPSKGVGHYVEFDGKIACSNCGKEMKEEDADIEGRYAFCSYKCHGQFVGAF